MFPTCAINNGRTREHPSAQVGCFRLAPLIMAELGNTRVLRKCGIFLCIDHLDCASLHPGYACQPVPAETKCSITIIPAIATGVHRRLRRGVAASLRLGV